MNLLEETDDDLRESLDTLRFLRFMLKDMRFMHVYSTLWIKHSSHYFKEIEVMGKLGEWKVFKSFRFLPEAYLKEQNRYALQFYVKPTFNPLWDDIEKKEWEYIRHPHTYLIKDSGDGVVYEEYLDGEKTIAESLSQLEWGILKAANEEVIGIETLKNAFPNVDGGAIRNTLKKLKRLGVLYYYKDYRNVITVINTECERNKQLRYT